MPKIDPFTPKNLLLLLLTITGCIALYKVTAFGESVQILSIPKQRVLDQQEYSQYLQHGNVSYFQDVKPILDGRCVVCHACYDAPCQLKLSSFEGLDRGATQETVYDTERINPAPPTRLFIDATDTAGWRAKSFYPVLNEWQDNAKANLKNSVLAKLLKLKRTNPTPASGKLPENFKLGLKRSLHCPGNDEFAEYQQKHPMWGMPYAMPGLTTNEENTLLDWLASGAKVTTRPPLSNRAHQEIEKWEKIFNGRSKKQQLVARYIYEHLFLGHIHFANHPADEFYYLVRSTTPPGKKINEVKAIRPFDPPGVKQFYYRLRPVKATIVDKNHFVYELSNKRLQRFQELFLDPDYIVSELPSYQSQSAANPFKTFIELPLTSRYQFLLDDAEFFFSAFIKGPVCRGQVAVNVIRDQFWVAFIKPDISFMQESADFLAANDQYLTLPAAGGDELGIFGWREYDALEETFLSKKEHFINKEFARRGGTSLDFIWDGNKENQNALLTVFRHYDTATVVKGFQGDTPLTGWVVDYPIFERIYYLLAAGFNVYGSAGHQVATRKYMDFLRVEAENNFLRFIPSDRREAIHRSWYQGISSQIFSLLNYSLDNINNKTRIKYKSSDYKQEFFTLIQQRLGKATGNNDLINRCSRKSCMRPGLTRQQQEVDEHIRVLAQLKGTEIKALPEVSFLRVRNGSAQENDLAYTLVRNTALSNVAFMFAENLRRTSKNDNLTIIPGLLGSYPNYFFSVTTEQLPEFIQQLRQTKNQYQREAFYRKFGIRRTNPDIWKHADWFNAQFKKEHPISSGLFDLNRYENL